MRPFQKIENPISIEKCCDRCKRRAYLFDLSDDGEAHEFISIAFTGGYGSIFGDGTAVKLELCQHCLKETLGEWLKVDKLIKRPAREPQHP